MKNIVKIGIMAALIFLAGCASPVKSKPMPPAPVPVNMATNVIPDTMDTNMLVISTDDAKPSLTWKDVGQKLNSKEGYIGLGFLVLAAVMAGLLIVFKKRKICKRW